MPVYEYYCRPCDNSFEVLTNLGAMAQDTVCPECHEDAPKALSLFASVIKAEGCESPSPLPTAPCQAAGGCACH